MRPLRESLCCAPLPSYHPLGGDRGRAAGALPQLLAARGILPGVKPSLKVLQADPDPNPKVTLTLTQGVRAAGQP